MSEGIWDKRVAAKVKSNVYKNIVRSAMLFGFETVAFKDQR